MELEAQTHGVSGIIILCICGHVRANSAERSLNGVRGARPPFKEMDGAIVPFLLFQGVFCSFNQKSSCCESATLAAE